MKTTPEIREFLAAAGKTGGQARARLPKKRRVELATLASKAAAEARTRKARLQKDG